MAKHKTRKIKAISHGTEKINIGNKPFLEMLPTQLHHKSNGSKDDKDSFLLVLEAPGVHEMRIVGQFSLKMFNDALGTIGFKIEKL